MSMSKDESIITQVAAKIAADLTSANDITTRLGEWAVAFETVRESLLDCIIGNGTTTAPAQQYTPTHIPDIPAVTFQQQVEQVFPNTTAISVQIKGKAHGPVPEWLSAMAIAKGVTTVWDERDKLQSNPKRPWFRSTEDKDVCFWPPRG